MNLEQISREAERTGDMLRHFELERGVVDLETGRFPMILATQGEAADGHILNIAGVRTKARMPMLFGHHSDTVIPSLGSVIEPRKDFVDGVPVLRQTGVFNLKGDDAMAKTRRSVAGLVANGDLNSVSFRWRGREMIRRTNLPKDHSSFVDIEKTDFEDPLRWGLFFKSSEAMEGSIVAIGSDPAALSGRAQQSSDKVERMFFQALARNCNEDGMADVALAFEAVNESIDGLRDIGCEPGDIITMLDIDPDTEMATLQFSDDGAIMVPKRVVDSIDAERRDALRTIIAVSYRDLPETEVQDSPEGDDDGPVPEVERYGAGTIGAMEPSTFFSGLSSALRERMTEAVYKATGRK